MVGYAENGSQAIESATSGDFCSVILDITMPDVNGLEVMSELKARDIEIPIIIITAQNTVKNAIDAMKLGAYDYVAKPFDLNEVTITVQRAIESYENAKRLDLLRCSHNSAGELKPPTTPIVCIL